MKETKEGSQVRKLTKKVKEGRKLSKKGRKVA